MSAYSNYVVSLSPVAYWQFIGASGVATVGADLSPDAGSCSVGQEIVDGDGSSTDFPGGNPFGPNFRGSNVAALRFVNRAPFTATFWARPTINTVDQNTSVVSQRDQDTGGWSISRGYTAGTRLTACRDLGGSEEEWQLDGFFEAAVVVFAAMAYDGDKWLIYKNGTWVADFASTGNIGSNTTQGPIVGSGQFADTPWFGPLAQVAIFDRALTADEIRVLWQLGAPSSGSTLRLPRRRSRGTSW